MNNFAMKIETYAKTAGLDRVPAAERYSLYRATHQRLLREDEDYRRQFNRYLSSVIVAAIVPGSVWLGSSVLGAVVSIFLSLVPVAAIVWLAFRQQRYMNERIGGALQLYRILHADQEGYGIYTFLPRQS